LKSTSPVYHFFITTLILSISTFLCFKLNAQEAITQYKKQPNRIRFSVSPVFYQPLHINNIGEPLLMSTPSFGGDASISYSQRLKGGFRINGGIGWSIISYNYGYHFLIPPGSIFDTGSNQVDYFTTHGTHLHNDQAAIIFPFSLQKIFTAKKNHSWQYNLELGFKINFKQLYPYSGSGSHLSYVEGQDYVEYFNMNIESTGDKRFTSYFFKAGLVKFNSRYNTWHCNLVYQYSPATIGTGAYYFSNLGFDSYGSLEQNANYLGLEIIYGLTLSKKLLRA